MRCMQAAWATKARSGLLGAGVVALVLAVSACGGGGGGDTTTTTSSETSAADWATGVCSSFTTWKTSLESIKTNVASEPSKSALQKAGQQIESATTTLTTSLKQLGKPDTAQGQAAKQNIDTLATSLETDMNKVKDTLNSTSSGGASSLSAISSVSATLASMAQNLTLAAGNLKSFAPSGELKQAFHESSACQPYFK